MIFTKSERKLHYMGAILEYKCPCCGGAIEFNSRLQKMKCPYCDTEFELDTLKQFEEEDKKRPSHNMSNPHGNEISVVYDCHIM